MPTVGDYYRSMSSSDVQRFVAATATTLVFGAALIFLLFRWIGRKFAAMGLGGGGESSKAGATALRIKRSPPASSAKDDAGSAAGNANLRLLNIVGGSSDSASESRHVPRGAQAALVQRGNRLLQEKKYDDALACYLSLLYAAVESSNDSNHHHSVLPAQLTDCLRGVGQCYMAVGKADIAVKFLQAERRVFEEMVVMAANPNGTKNTPNRSIIASLLGKKSDVSMPKRCFTLTEVADACTKLGQHDIALAYRVKAAALKQRISGEPLNPESEEAALLAQSLHEFQTRHGSNSTAAVISETATRIKESKGSDIVSEEDVDAATARAQIEEELRRRGVDLASQLPAALSREGEAQSYDPPNDEKSRSEAETKENDSAR